MDGRATSEAWNVWLQSDEGERCMAEGAYGEYLRNRLFFAFIAGAQAAERWASLQKKDTSRPSGNSK